MKKILNKADVIRIFFTMVTALIIALMFYVCVLDNITYSTDAPDAVEAHGIQQGEQIYQSITGVSGKLKSIDVKIGTYGRVNNGLLNVTLAINGQSIEEWNISANEIKDNDYYRFKLSKIKNIKNSDILILTIGEDYKGDNNVAIYLSGEGYGFETSILGKLDKTICYRLTLQNEHIVHVGVLFIIMIEIVALFILCLTDFWKSLTPKKCLICIVLLFVAFVVVGSIAENVRANVGMYDFNESCGEINLKKDESIDVTINASRYDFSAFEIIVGSKYNTNISIDIKNTGTGKEYNVKNLSNYDFINEAVIDKNVLCINAYSIEKLGKEKFPAGYYKLHIKNKSDEDIALEIADKDDTSSINHYILLRTNIGYYIIFVVLSVLLVGVEIFFIFVEKNYKIEHLYLALAIPIIISMFILICPWNTPDSGAHLGATYRLSNMFTGNPEWSIRDIDQKFFEDKWYESNPSINDYATLISSNMESVTGSEIIQMPDYPLKATRMEYYSAINYIPQTIGFVMARLFRFDTIGLLFMGKLFIAVFYVFGGYIAIRRTPIAKGVLLIMAVLPISMMMGVAFSYDGMVIVSSLNFISCIFALKEKYSKKVLLECILWTFVIGATKGGGYLVLLPLVFIIFEKKEDIKRILAIITSGVASVVFFDKVMTIGMTLFQFGNDTDDRMKASFAVIHPFLYVKMLILTGIKFCDAFFFQMLGSSMGHLEFVIDTFWIMSLFIITLTISLYERDSSYLFKRKDRIIMSFVILVVLITTPMMLLSWTPIGNDVIEGIQGRYFLPIVPLMVVVLTKFRLKNSIRDDYEERDLIINRCYKSIAVTMVIFVICLLRRYVTR